MDLRDDDDIYFSYFNLPTQKNSNKTNGKKFSLDNTYRIYCQMCKKYDEHTIFICPELKQNIKK